MQICRKEKKKPIDQRLEGIVNKMFQRCLDYHKYKQAIGIALETRRLDVFEKTILESNDVPGMLAYSLKLCMSLMQNKQFRNKVLRVLVKIYMNLEKPDFINVCQVLLLHCYLTLHHTTSCCTAGPCIILHYIIVTLMVSYMYLS